MMKLSSFPFGDARGRLLKPLLALALALVPLSLLRAHEPQDAGHAGSTQGMETSDDPLQAWTTVQQTAKDMETAVQSKHLHGVHEPSMKIRPAIRTLKAHSGMMAGEKGDKISASLKQLDGSVTDLHSAADEGNQPQAETALQGLKSALDQLKAQDPGTFFKNMH